MAMHLKAWQLRVVILASLVNRDQQRVIEYLVDLVKTLMEERMGKRLSLNGDQRRRLAVKAKVLTLKQILDLGVPFHPDTLLRWHRTLVAKKWDYSERRKKTGWPETDREIVKLIL